MADVILDFHGTLYKDTTEGPLRKYVAGQVVKPLEAARHPIRTLAFARAKPEIEQLVAQYERGEIMGYGEIYEAFNHYVLSRLPPDFVENAIKKYACLLETTDKLDMRMLRPMYKTSGRYGILSTGSGTFIGEIFSNTDFRYMFSPIIANPVITTNRGSSSVHFSPKDKPRLIEGVFVPAGFDPRKTVYVGDNADDEPAFRHVLERGGKVAVSLLAERAFREDAATKYDAFVPETEYEWRKVLESVA